ncbi:MAG: alcohol dehydrogenase catalytic domain-containing protein [Actinobacteria bacterium]|nr:alcohol dehydrogenase catalytic domain-containing protein [Actinomycetota bacterium]
MEHEFTGIIKEVGLNVRKFKVFDRVVVATGKTFICGNCSW